MEPALMSEIMSELKAAMGVEWHKTTAAYSPQHNGQLERYMQTIGIALRKLAELNNEDWEKWPKFIDYAYNTRVNTVTKMTPYEALFGVKANTFSDWNSFKKEENCEEELIKRGAEIRDILEKREHLVKVVDEAQEKQKDIQNARTSKILRTFLPNDTVVYRKNDGILSNSLHVG